MLEQIEGKYEISEDEAKQYIEKAETDILQQTAKYQQEIDSLKQDKENIDKELKREKKKNIDSQNQLKDIVSFISGILAYIIGLIGLVLLYILCFTSLICQDLSIDLVFIQLEKFSFEGRFVLNIAWVIIFVFYLKGKIKYLLEKQILNHLSRKSYVGTK